MRFFNYQDLYKLAASRYGANGTFVEVGVWMGDSACFLAEECSKQGDAFHIWLVDKFKGCEWTGKFLPEIDSSLGEKSGFIHLAAKRAKESGYLERFSFLQADSQKSARIIDDGSCDFVFIDADHSYESARGDIAAWRPKVRSGGILAGHDFNWPGVRKAVTERFSHVKIHQYPGHCWAIEIP